MTIAIDWDGTMTYHDYPFIVESVPGAMDTVRKIKQAGHQIILLTMRTDALLDEAIAFARLHDIEFDFVNCNMNFETGSRKVYASLYIDDHCLGVPLIHDQGIHKKPFVDWVKVDEILSQRGFYVSH